MIFYYNNKILNANISVSSTNEVYDVISAITDYNLASEGRFEGNTDEYVQIEFDIETSISAVIVDKTNATSVEVKKYSDNTFTTVIASWVLDLYNGKYIKEISDSGQYYRVYLSTTKDIYVTISNLYMCDKLQIAGVYANYTKRINANTIRNLTLTRQVYGYKIDTYNSYEVQTIDYDASKKAEINNMYSVVANIIPFYFVLHDNELNNTIYAVFDDDTIEHKRLELEGEYYNTTLKITEVR